jgi:hypothetical protein
MTSGADILSEKQLPPNLELLYEQPGVVATALLKEHKEVLRDYLHIEGPFEAVVYVTLRDRSGLHYVLLEDGYYMVITEEEVGVENLLAIADHVIGLRVVKH